jgi:glycosyltransferase involved in cell wall biosynthesis
VSALPHNPLVTTIIPVHNGGNYLAEALESVLAQGISGCEVIVVDDGSTDDSGLIAQDFGSAVRYIYQPQGGPGSARNLGVAEARGQFVAFLDADDRWMERKLEIQLAAFDADPTLDVAFGHVQQGLSPELDLTQAPTKRFAMEVVPGHLPGTMLARREAYFQVGPFSTRWTLGDGIDWYLRAVDLQLRMRMLPDVLLWRRIHDTNIGIRQRSSRQDYVHIMKAALDRRRSSVGPYEGFHSTPRPDDPAVSSQE